MTNRRKKTSCFAVIQSAYINNDIPWINRSCTTH